MIKGRGDKERKEGLRGAGTKEGRGERGDRGQRKDEGLRCVKTKKTCASDVLLAALFLKIATAGGMLATENF